MRILSTVRKNYKILAFLLYNIKVQLSKYKNFMQIMQFFAYKNLFILDDLEKDYLKKLHRDGFVLIDGFFSNKEIDQIKLQIDKLLENEKNCENSGECLFNHKDKKVVANPFKNILNLSEIALHPLIYKLAVNYKKLIPFNIVNVYRTEVMKKKIGSSFFHRDAEGDFTYFIYLEDIDNCSGALQYVKGSHNFNYKSFMPITNHDKGLREDGNIAYSENEILKYYKDNDIVTAIGKKGTLLIADTTGFHKGPNWSDECLEKRSRSVIHGVYQQRLLFDNNLFQEMKMSLEVYKSLSREQKMFLKRYSIEE